MAAAPTPNVLRVAELSRADLEALLGRYGLALELVAPAAPIPGSFWGEPEAGVRGTRIYARADTPVHSLLHETCHVICMSDDRRRTLDTDAGGDDLEEAAVCYLQVLLAAELPGVGTRRLMQDMDAWGYSFRLGSTARWFAEDAADALAWLARTGLVDAAGRPIHRFLPG